MFEDIEPEISHVLRYAIAVLVFNMTKVYLKFSDSSLKLLNRLGIICFDICDVSGANIAGPVFTRENAIMKNWRQLDYWTLKVAVIELH